MSFWKTRKLFTGEWLTVNKKKILAHGLILAVFALYCFFLAEPLFDRLERIDGESELQTISLPAVTNNINYYIDFVNFNINGIWLNGSANIKGKTIDDCLVYFILKSRTDTYVFNSLPYQIMDPVLNTIGAGFLGILPLRNVNKGEYLFGIYIKKGNTDALQYTEWLAIKSKDSVQVTLLPSQLYEVSLPPESVNIEFNIDYAEGPANRERDFEEIQGWAFIRNQSTEDNKIYVVLKSERNTYVFDTWTKDTPWVPDHLGFTDLGLDRAGFIARIPDKEIQNGTYRLGIYIEKGPVAALQYIDWAIVKSNNDMQLMILSSK